eukprot:2221496-Rhodomonas_salina.2
MLCGLSGLGPRPPSQQALRWSSHLSLPRSLRAHTSCHRVCAAGSHILTACVSLAAGEEAQGEEKKSGGASSRARRSLNFLAPRALGLTSSPPNKAASKLVPEKQEQVWSEVRSDLSKGRGPRGAAPEEGQEWEVSSLACLSALSSFTALSSPNSDPTPKALGP